MVKNGSRAPRWTPLQFTCRAARRGNSRLRPIEQHLAGPAREGARRPAIERLLDDDAHVGQRARPARSRCRGGCDRSGEPGPDGPRHRTRPIAPPRAGRTSLVRHQRADPPCATSRASRNRAITPSRLAPCHTNMPPGLSTRANSRSTRRSSRGMEKKPERREDVHDGVEPVRPPDRQCAHVAAAVVQSLSRALRPRDTERDGRSSRAHRPRSPLRQAAGRGVPGRTAHRVREPRPGGPGHRSVGRRRAGRARR